MKNIKSQYRYVLIFFALLFGIIGSYLLFSSQASSLAADFNNDNSVNIYDLSILAGNWNKTSATKAIGDANNDTVVNIFDLSILASLWGQSVSPTPTPTTTPTPTPNGQTFNVLNYGAKGDGVTNDAPAFQSAFNAAHAANGGTVLFPSGRTYLVGTNWAMPAIKTNDYFTKAANGTQVWSTPSVKRSGTIVVSGYGATIKHVASRVGFLHTAWPSNYWETYGNIVIEGFTFDDNNTQPGGSTGRIFWTSGAGNTENVVIKDVKLINVPKRISTEYGGVNGVLIRADWTEADRLQPRWGFTRNITIQDSDIQAHAKPIVINLETPSIAHGSPPGQNQYMIDNVLIERVKTDNLKFYGSSIHIGGAASGKSVIVRDSDMRNSSDDGLEINSFDSILAENNTFSGTRQSICLVWFGYPYSSTPPSVVLRNNKYTGNLGAYWEQSVATEPEQRAPMVPEARAYTTDSQLKDRSWGHLTIDGGDFEFGVTEEWGTWKPTITIGSNGYPMSSVTIKNVRITADGPNSGDFISVRQGSQLGSTLPVTIQNVQVRRSVGASYAPITNADIYLSGATNLTLSP